MVSVFKTKALFELRFKFLVVRCTHLKGNFRVINVLFLCLYQNNILFVKAVSDCNRHVSNSCCVCCFFCMNYIFPSVMHSFTYYCE
jgi:hypothetical protein